MRFLGNRLASGCCGLFALVLLGFAGFGCGTDFNNVLFQSLAAAGRSALDVGLTDFANTVADAADNLNAPDAADQSDGAGDNSGGGDSGGSDGGMTPALDGDAPNGRLIYEASGCVPCHCDDGSGGCALSAPSVQGSDIALVGDKLSGAVGHAGGTTELGGTELADLATYLAELAGGGPDSGGAPDQGAGGDPAAGQGLFGSNGCGTCHCDDASGGCALSAPSIQGVDAALVTDKLTGAVGHTGGTRELDEVELADLAAYLVDLAGGGGSDVMPDPIVDPDVGSGRVLYEDNGCGSCHCADGTGGCALSAPAITGATTTVLDEFLLGATTHTGGKKDLSDGGIASLAAFLAGS